MHYNSKINVFFYSTVAAICMFGFFGHLEIASLLAPSEFEVNISHDCTTIAIYNRMHSACQYRLNLTQ